MMEELGRTTTNISDDSDENGRLFKEAVSTASAWRQVTSAHVANRKRRRALISNSGSDANRML
jgi:hypothetical protein